MSTLDLSHDQMVASVMRWFGLPRREAEQHVEKFVEQRDIERGRREARKLREQEGL